MEPFRFVHAARLLLDHQLHGLTSLPDELRSLVEDATLAAFEQLVETCVARQVDGLLLAGDSFDQRDGSLRGCAALARGLERLDAHDICTVVVAGTSDPWAGWPDGFQCPGQVVRLGLDADAETPLSRRGRLLATVRTASPPDPLAPPQSERQPNHPLGGSAPCSIVLHSAGEHGGDPMEFIESRAAAGPAGDYADAHYWAVGGAPHSRTHEREQRLLHDPGPTQAVRPLETGPRGCTLVEVSAGGEFTSTFVPTAPVRYEHFELNVAADTTQSDLLEAMRVALRRAPRYTTDRLWLPAWDIFGEGPLTALLADPEARDRLLDKLHSQTAVDGLQIFTQALRMHLPRGTSGPAADGDALALEFDRRVQGAAVEPAWSLQKCLAGSSLADGPWERQLSTILDELDDRFVVQEARRVGQDWFAAGQERSP
ncbi:MAG: metallophosphoesterase family protein [Planctomycetaceae bacterium]